MHRLIENEIRENLIHERKLLTSHQQNELDNMKQATEKEKQVLQEKLRYANDIYFIWIVDSICWRRDMLSDLNLEQENNTNIQIRLLQIKHENEEV